MKRLKQLMVIGLVAVMVFAFSACSSSNTDEPESKVLSSISVDTSTATTTYYVGESFSYSGIVVTATYSDNTESVISSGNYSVDSSAYDSSKAGTYSIGISYTENEVSQKTSYSVTVSEAAIEETGYGGLYVTKTTTKYTVSSVDGVTVNTDDLSVYLVDQDGNVTDTALSSSEYTLKYYQVKDTSIIAIDNLVEIDSFANLSEGYYELGIFTENPYSDDFDQLSYYLAIEVTDSIVSIALSNAETGTFTQNVGTQDTMSSTWEFTLTHASGYTETISGDNANLTITGIDTLTAKEEATANVVYTKTATDGSTYDVSCTVTYSITKLQGGGESESSGTSVDIDIADVATAMGATISGGTELVTGSGVYICGASTDSYDLNSSSKAIYDNEKGEVSETKLAYRLKIGGGITFTEGLESYTVSDVTNGICIMAIDAATVTVYVRSSSGSASRVVALYDSTGTQLSTADVPTATSGDYVYEVTFTISEAGVYYFGSTASGIGVYAISISY